MEIGALSDEEELLARRKFFQRLVLDSDEPSIVKLQPELANLSLSFGSLYATSLSINFLSCQAQFSI
jgi:hypothetical protein